MCFCRSHSRKLPAVPVGLEIILLTLREKNEMLCNSDTRKEERNDPNGSEGVWRQTLKWNSILHGCCTCIVGKLKKPGSGRWRYVPDAVSNNVRALRVSNVIYFKKQLLALYSYVHKGFFVIRLLDLFVNTGFLLLPCVALFEKRSIASELIFYLMKNNFFLYDFIKLLSQALTFEKRSCVRSILLRA